MTTSAEILQELQTISPLLAKMDKNNVFSYPDGYFDTLSIDVFKTIAASDTNIKALSVPEGYFNNLSTTILNKIKAIDNPSEELRSLSPMLYSIQNENVFTVPRGYFTGLQDTILSQVAPKAKSVRMKSNFIWKYAAAAVLTGVIGISSLLVYNKSETVSDNNITSYIQEASQIKNESQLNAAITMLSDEEIIKYLETTGSETDNEVLTQSIEEKELPDKSDF